MKHLYRLLFIPLILPILNACNNNEVIYLEVKNSDINKGEIFIEGDVNKIGSKVTIKAVPKDKYLFTSWYLLEDESECVFNFDSTFTYEVTNEKKVLIARWEDYSTQTFTFSFDKDTNEFTISNYSGTSEDDYVIVPKTHYGYPVTKIADSTFANKTNIVYVTVPEGITSIGKEAFSNMSNAKHLNLPSSLLIAGDLMCQSWTKTQQIHVSKQSIKEFTIEETKEKIYCTTWGWLIDKLEGQDDVYSVRDSRSGIPYPDGANLSADRND